MDDEQLRGGLSRILTDIGDWSRALCPRQALRPYQLEPARAILAAVEAGQGGQFALVFSRQAGKDETLAQLIGFLLTRHHRSGGSVVMGSPTLEPQSAISRNRLRERVTGNLLTGRLVGAGGPNSVALGKATATYLSAGPQANARGATASLLLVANEAQDIDPAAWDARFDPMGASTNAVTVFSGTVWSDRTLLARQMRFLRAQEAQDGRKRVFTIDWTRVAEDVPAYGDRVRQRIAQLGEDHPFIRTEYRLIELDSAGGLFPAARRALLAGLHARQRQPEAGKLYAILVDVGGQEEDNTGDVGDGADLRAAGTRRDSTAVTVVEVAPGARAEESTYRVVDRLLWTGLSQTRQHSRLHALANHWGARAVVVDATGIGAGLASFLVKSLGERKVYPFQFTAQSKAALGWAMVGAIDSGRLKEYARDSTEETRTFWQQLEQTTYEVRPGPGKLMSWGVDDPRLHDDLVLSLALVGHLDTIDLRPRVAIGR